MPYDTLHRSPRFAHVALAIVIITVAFCPADAAAAPPLADPAFLEHYAETYRFTHGRPTGIRVTDDGAGGAVSALWPAQFRPRSVRVRHADRRRNAAGHRRKNLGRRRGQLTPEELARRERMRSAARGIASFDISDDGSRCWCRSRAGCT